MCVYTKENISMAKTLSYKKEGLKLKSQNLISVAQDSGNICPKRGLSVAD